MENIKIKKLNNYKTMVSIGHKTIYLTDKNKRKEVIKRITETVFISILMAGIMGILYIAFFGPYDYWTKKDGYMIKYHVDWDGEETMVDSYYIE